MSQFTNAPGALSGVVSLPSGATSGGDILFTTATPTLGISTTDGSDTGVLGIAPGSTSPADGTRGAEIELRGNEASTPGQLALLAGSAGGKVLLKTMSASDIDIFTNATSAFSFKSGGSALFNSATPILGISTADAADNKILAISSGSTAPLDGTRGAEIQLQGNEAAAPGRLSLLAGSAGGTLDLKTMSANSIQFFTNSTAAAQVTSGGAFLFDSASPLIGINTADASDSKVLKLSGGSTAPGDGTRGAEVYINGNESSGNAGRLVFLAGTGSGGTIDFSTTASKAINFATNNSNRAAITAAGDLQLDASTGGNLLISKPGKGIQISAAANGTVGTATFVTGFAVVSTTAITANSYIFFSRQNVHVAPMGHMVETARTPGVSFRIDSDNGADVSTFVWMLIEPL